MHRHRRQPHVLNQMASYDMAIVICALLLWACFMWTKESKANERKKMNRTERVAEQRKERT